MDEIVKERAKQYVWWGDQRHDISTWLVILMEEVGEAAQAIFEHKYEDGDIDGVRKELVHCAAVAIQIIENIDQDVIRKQEQ